MNVSSFLGEIAEILDGERFSLFTQEMLDSVIDTLRERGNSNATINRKNGCLEQIAAESVQDGDIYNLPEFRRQKEREGRIRFLEAEEGQRLFAAIRARCEDSYRLRRGSGAASATHWSLLERFAGQSLHVLADEIRPQPHGPPHLP